MSNSLNLGDTTSYRTLAKGWVTAELSRLGREVGADVEEMFVIMVRQLALARVLEDRLLTVMAEMNRLSRSDEEINDHIVKVAGELSAELIAALNAHALRCGTRGL